MPADRSLRVTATSDRPIEEVWARLADAAGWKDWTNFTRSALEEEGDPAPDGIGAVRRFGIGPMTSVEEVVAFEPPTHFAYVLRKGLPVKGYRADVELASTPSGGTHITWSSTWDRNPPPNALWRRFLTSTVGRVAKDLAKA
jgi:uncharacterized protein YndB with AHSA1/START domain